MKKLVYYLVLSLFTICAVGGNTAFASSSEILSDIEDISKESESLELIDVDELPKGTPFIYFNTVEDFEKDRDYFYKKGKYNCKGVQHHKQF